MYKNILAYFSPRSAELPATQNHRLKRVSERTYVSFASTTNQYVIYIIPRFPDFYQGGTLKCDILAYADAVEGEIKWNIEVESVTNENEISDAKFEYESSISQKIPTEPNKAFTSTIEINTKPNIGNLIRLKLTRDALNDSVIEDAKLISVVVYEEISDLNLTKYDSVKANSFNALKGIKIPELHDTDADLQTIYFSLDHKNLVYKSSMGIYPIMFKDLYSS